jgi:succinate dehydrogenase hydrophobic anchor subunit
MQDNGEDRKRRPMRLEWLLSRVDHVAAWISAAIMVLYILSGYGMTQAARAQTLTGGLMTPGRAFTLHNNLYIPLLITFTFHTFMGLRRVLIRTTRRKLVAGWMTAGIGAVALVYFALLGGV